MACLSDSTAGQKVIFYRKVVKDDELISRIVYYFARISIMENYAGDGARLLLQPDEITESL